MQNDEISKAVKRIETGWRIHYEQNVWGLWHIARRSMFLYASANEAKAEYLRLTEAA